MPKKKTKKKVGRPLFDGKSEKTVLSKLEWAFSIGATDAEACNHAEISLSALGRYQQKNPEFREQKEVLKETPILKARKAIFDRLDDPDFAMKFMERKKKDEFSVRQEWTGAAGRPLSDIDETHAVKIAQTFLKAQKMRNET